MQSTLHQVIKELYFQHRFGIRLPGYNFKAEPDYMVYLKWELIVNDKERLN